jgi:hypothetical protein
VSTESLYHLFSRVFFFTALATLALVVAELLANLAGYTILRDVYSKGRLLELAAILLVFVIAVLLRQIRDELKAGRRA